jgi:hypothetical protein
MAFGRVHGYDRERQIRTFETTSGAQRMARHLTSNLLGLAGAAVGGALGFYTFDWLEGHGFYGLAIPGAFLGLGCGLLAQHRSLPRGILCGAAALALSVFTEWWFHPFLVDNSLVYLITHLTSKNSVTLLMIGIGTLIAFWVGKDAGFRVLPERWRARAETGQGSAGSG